jgi:hypothetical protein
MLRKTDTGLTRYARWGEFGLDIDGLLLSAVAVTMARQAKIIERSLAAAEVASAAHENMVAEALLVIEGE